MLLQTINKLRLAVEQAVNSLENHTYHLGRSDNALLQHMLERGQGYLQAVPTYESTVIDYNHKFGDQLRSKYGDDLVFIYPRQSPQLMCR